MRAKITKAALAAAPAGETLWDTELQGFGAKVRDSGVTFVVQVEVGSRTSRVRRRIRKATIGRLGPWTVEKARKEALQLIAGFKGEPEGPDEPTLADGVRIHLERMTKLGRAKVSIDSFRRLIPRYAKDLLEHTLSELTTPLLEARHSRLTEDHGPALANLVLRHLSAAINSAAARHDLPTRRILAGVTMNRMVRKNEPFDGQQGRLSLTQWWERVWQLPSENIRDIQITALLTGLREKNVLGMRWEHIDLERASIHVPNPKSRKPFDVPLAGFLVELLRRRKAALPDDEVFVFPGRAPGTHHAKSKANGLPSLHRCRNTWATMAQAAGVDWYSLKVLLNHRVPTDVTSGYVSPQLEALRVHVERVAEVLTAGQAFPAALESVK